jgi:C1A family cysteine protease
MARKSSKLVPHKVKKYGWVADLPDHRDRMYAVHHEVLQALPSKVDLRPKCPPVYNQLQLGSCTGNAIAAAVQFERMKNQLKPAFDPSRLFIYYNERVIEGTVASDSGAQIRDGIKSVAKLGDCPETLWPYVISKFAVTPGNQCYAAAKPYKAIAYRRVPRTLSDMKGCLAEGYPFVFGFSVYSSFESRAVAGSGVVPMPASGEKLLGGHAVLAVGYDSAQQRFIVRNSWGPGWGMSGYFTMPFAYLLDSNLSDDFWMVALTAH